jgi:hypothetical protein
VMLCVPLTDTGNLSPVTCFGEGLNCFSFLTCNLEAR